MQPSFNIGKTLSIGDVINNDDPMSASVVSEQQTHFEGTLSYCRAITKIDAGISKCYLRTYKNSIIILERGLSNNKFSSELHEQTYFNKCHKGKSNTNVDVMVLNLSCPAVSQMCSLTRCPSMSSVRILKSTPIVLM